MGEKRARMSRPALLGSLLGSAFEGTPAGRVLKEGRIWLVWDEAMGKEVAARARPVRFAAGVLTIAVTTPAWLQQLNYLKQEILRKLNTAIGEPMVTDIFLKAGMRPAASPAPAPDRSFPAPELTVAEQKEIDLKVSGVPDPELRATFAEVLKKSYRKR